VVLVPEAVVAEVDRRPVVVERRPVVLVRRPVVLVAGQEERSKM